VLSSSDREEKIYFATVIHNTNPHIIPDQIISTCVITVTHHVNVEDVTVMTLPCIVFLPRGKENAMAVGNTIRPNE